MSGNGIGFVSHGAIAAGWRARAWGQEHRRQDRRRYGVRKWDWVRFAFPEFAAMAGRSSMASRLSLSRATCSASRPWRKAFWGQRCFPSSATGLWERAPWAREYRAPWAREYRTVRSEY